MDVNGLMNTAPQRRDILDHFFLLDFVVDHVAGGELLLDFLQSDALLGHEHHHMVGKVRNFIDGFSPILRFGGDDDLGAFLAHLFQNLVQALLEQVSGVGALGQVPFPAFQQSVEALIGKFLPGSTLKYRVVEAADFPGVAGGAVGLHLDYESVLVAVGGDGYNVLVITEYFPWRIRCDKIANI